MKKHYYWNEESFGSNCPTNWEEIADAVNAHMDDFLEENGNDEEMAESHSERLWEQFCEDGEICGVSAEWEEDDVPNLWYAYQGTEDEREEGAWDHDGTEDREEALNWLREQYDSGNPDAQVAVVDVDDSFCVDILYTDLVR